MYLDGREGLEAEKKPTPVWKDNGTFQEVAHSLNLVLYPRWCNEFDKYMLSTHLILVLSDGIHVLE